MPKFILIMAVYYDYFRMKSVASQLIILGVYLLFFRGGMPWENYTGIETTCSDISRSRECVLSAEQIDLMARQLDELCRDIED